MIDIEGLTKIAAKMLQEDMGFNEITLSDGTNTVHLVRYTPMPNIYSGNWQWQYPPVTYHYP